MAYYIFFICYYKFPFSSIRCAGYGNFYNFLLQTCRLTYENLNACLYTNFSLFLCMISQELIPTQNWGLHKSGFKFTIRKIALMSCVSVSGRQDHFFVRPFRLVSPSTLLKVEWMEAENVGRLESGHAPATSTSSVLSFYHCCGIIKKNNKLGRPPSLTGDFRDRKRQKDVEPICIFCLCFQSFHSTLPHSTPFHPNMPRPLRYKNPKRWRRRRQR